MCGCIGKTYFERLEQFADDKSTIGNRSADAEEDFHDNDNVNPPMLVINRYAVNSTDEGSMYF